MPGNAERREAPAYRGRRRPARAPLAALGTILLLATATACGIRPTEVPTDFGAAPSRLPCVLDDESESSGAPGSGASSPSSADTLPVQIYLVCGSQLVDVERTVRGGRTDGAPASRLGFAQQLMTELLRRPTDAERAARFASSVRSGTTVSGPLPGDPATALRLNVPPEDLSAFALAQVVCTLAHSAAAAPDGAVWLGGPERDSLKPYRCTPAVLRHPGTTAPPTTAPSPSAS